MFMAREHKLKALNIDTKKVNNCFTTGKQGENLFWNEPALVPLLQSHYNNCWNG